MLEDFTRSRINGNKAWKYCRRVVLAQQLEDFTFTKRTRRPPKDTVNALLSFGYQLLWNHLLAIIDLWGLDPYHACLHQNNEQHAVLASDLIEQFRAPIDGFTARSRSMKQALIGTNILSYFLKGDRRSVRFTKNMARASSDLT